MNPILYATVTEGTVPSNYGIGVLTDCIKCEIKEELNGSYELTMDYAAEGIHAADIVPGAVLKAKPNYTDDPQLFRIYKVGKTINGRFTVNAAHISYDLSGKVIASGSAGSCVAACALLEGSAGNFTINTDKTVSASFSVSEPSSVRSWFGGKQGSLLEVFGGEWYYNNYTASLKQSRGADRNVTIRYGKNLVDLSQELNMENLVTGVIPYYKDNSTDTITTGTKVSTGLVLDHDRDIAVDFSEGVDPESGTAITTQLATLAAAYIAKNNFVNINNSITLDFVQLEGLTERVDLGDTCHIYFEALGVSASIKCIATVWDVLEGRYTSTSFGEAKTNIADTIATAEKEVKEKPSTSMMDKAITRATEMITGNLGGYVILHDADGNGYPDEFLIMDTADITTATKVWRFNKNGLGYSGNGYAGPFDKIALTADGKINATEITTGTLNADLIKAGTIEDVNHKSSIDMTTGQARLYMFDAVERFRLIDANDDKKAEITHSNINGSILKLFRDNLTEGARLGSNGDVVLSDAGGVEQVNIYVTANGGHILLKNTQGNTGVSVFTLTNGGNIALYNANGETRATFFISDSLDSGFIRLFNTNGDRNIYLEGDDGTIDTGGDIYCVNIHTQSSRKIKKNIKPIEDARKILELEAVQFDFKDKKKGTNKRGFIAEDVAAVLPNLVTPEHTQDDGHETVAALDYIGMVPYLQAIIKEQETRIKKLEELINGTD